MKISIITIILTPLLFCFMLFGCTVKLIEPIKLPPFNVNKAKSMLEKGNNTIKGSALVRQWGGGIVTCAGCKVSLIPATKYAKMIMFGVYGNQLNGYRDTGFSKCWCPNLDLGRWVPAHHGLPGRYESGDYYKPWGWRKKLNFLNCDPRYHQFMKTTIGNTLGFFSFFNVKEGDWFIVLPIKWGALNNRMQGGYLMQHVKVSGGETKEIVLAPILAK